MNNRVLFVDDDPMLLSSMERCLGDDFDLSTALSGPDALRAIEHNPMFGVIISDMRMPVMDGVEFLQRAGSLSPHSVLMMLTGNQDVQTAARAVNEGRVANFINKPCDPRDIAAAIRAGLNRFDLEESERELLSKTLSGAVEIMTDVMETLQPKLIGRAAHADELVEQLRARLNIAPQWEYKLASKLSLVGYALAPEAPSFSPPESTGAVGEITARMIDRIPRLSRVAQIVQATSSSDGWIENTEATEDQAIVSVGAALLRLAQLIEGYSYDGVDAQEAHDKIQSLMPRLSADARAHAMDLYPGDFSTQGVEVPIECLLPGMILQEDLARPDGVALISEGRRLTQNHIDKLQSDERVCIEGGSALITSESYNDTSEEAPAAMA